MVRHTQATVNHLHAHSEDLAKLERRLSRVQEARRLFHTESMAAVDRMAAIDGSSGLVAAARLVKQRATSALEAADELLLRASDHYRGVTMAMIRSEGSVARIKEQVDALVGLQHPVHACALARRPSLPTDFR
jgi:hypothetical protein